MKPSAKREAVNPKGVPPPSGPYSRAVRYGGLVFVSGISARTSDGTPLRGSIEEETTNILENIRITLEGAGSSMDRVLKMTVVLSDSEDWPRMNAVYKTFFPKDPPARTTFQAELGDAKVEMDATAAG